MGNNPRNVRFQAACCREASSRETDDVRREALLLAADNLERMAEAIPAIKAVLAIYGAFPDARVEGIKF